MGAQITTEQVWQVLSKEPFAVIGMVTEKGEARTAGIVYVARDRKLYIGTGKDTWKARHIAANPPVSMTVCISKQVPFMPWIKVPAATITFSGQARVLPVSQVSPELVKELFRGMADEPNRTAEMCMIEVTPVGHFVTYGVGVSLMQMRDPEQARGRVAVT
jgi:hypothetical protein